MAGTLERYFSRCRELLLHPAGFFRGEFYRISTSSALALGLATAWVMTLLTFVVDSMLNIALQKLLENWLEGYLSVAERFPDFQAEAKLFLIRSGSVLLYPFILSLQLVVGSSVIYGFAKLFIQDQTRLTYASCLKIMALAMVSSWLWLVPLVGPLLGLVMFMAILVIGVREVFWVSTRRALLVILTPQVLFVVIASLAIFLALLFAAIATQLGTLGVEII